jgi:Family of unknown function (DUF6263)
MILPLLGGVSMLRRFIGAMLLLVVGLVLPVRAQSPIEWKLKTGDHFYLRNVTTTKQTVKALNKDVVQNSEQTIVLGFTVAEKVGDNFLLKETIEEVTIKPDKGESFSDSKLVGVTFALTVSPKWEILKFEGYDKLVDKLAGDDMAVRQAITAILPEDVFKKTVREAMGFLPDRAIKDGEAWERSVEVPWGSLGTMTLTRIYKLEGKDNSTGKPLDKITFTTAVEFKPGKKAENLTYYVVSGKIEVKESKGTVLFDPAASQLVQIKSDLKLVGTMALSVSDTRVDEVVEQEQSTVVTVLKEKPEKK